MTLLNKQERKVLGILSTGTFIEYLFLYLYVHFSGHLNKLFFAETSAEESALITAFSYSMCYLFRPIGALILGWIGDAYGRKTVINLTFFLMGVSCIGICFLPTYAQIGVSASILIMLFRVLQSVSSMGEIIGGEIYLVEYMKGRSTFLSFGIVDIMASVGCEIALFLIGFAIAGVFSFRYLFAAGLLIFVLGYHVRRTLLESTEYLKAKNSSTAEESGAFKSTLSVLKEMVTNKTYVAAFFIDALPSVTFFLSVVGLNDILRNDFGFSEADIVTRNIYATYFCLGYGVIASLFCIKFNPIKLSKFRNVCSIALIASIPFLLNNNMSVDTLVAVQSALCFLCISDVHIGALVLKNIPILKRFRVVALSFAFSRAIIALVTSLGLVLLKPYFGNSIYAVFGLPFAIMFFFAVRHFEKLDRANPNGLLQHYN